MGQNIARTGRGVVSREVIWRGVDSGNVIGEGIVSGGNTSRGVVSGSTVSGGVGGGGSIREGVVHGSVGWVTAEGFIRRRGVRIHKPVGGGWGWWRLMGWRLRINAMAIFPPQVSIRHPSDERSPILVEVCEPPFPRPLVTSISCTVGVN